MGTLYVVGAPPGDPDDITLRARRILAEVTLVGADDADQARRLLAHYDVATPVAKVGDLWEALDAGDAALLSQGWLPGPSDSSYQLICAAIERGFPVVPVPGPTLPVTALVISGLPADSFVYLGELPRDPSARRDLLALVAGERRSLVAIEWPDRLPGTLVDLVEALGDRSLAVVAASDTGIDVIWRGALGEAPAHLPSPPGQALCTLVVGVAREKADRWDCERLRAEIRACLERELGTKEISRQLAAESGWPRREVYRLAVELARHLPQESEGKEW